MTLVTFFQPLNFLNYISDTLHDVISKFKPIFSTQAQEFGNSARVLLLPVLINYTLTNNDGVQEQAGIFLADIKTLIQEKTKEYNYMVHIPRKLGIFKHKQKLA